MWMCFGGITEQNVCDLELHHLVHEGHQNMWIGLCSILLFGGNITCLEFTFYSIFAGSYCSRQTVGMHTSHGDLSLSLLCSYSIPVRLVSLYTWIAPLPVMLFLPRKWDLNYLLSLGAYCPFQREAVEAPQSTLFIRISPIRPPFVEFIWFCVYFGLLLGTTSPQTLSVLSILFDFS